MLQRSSMPVARLDHVNKNTKEIPRPKEGGKRDARGKKGTHKGYGQSEHSDQDGQGYRRTSLDFREKGLN